MRPASDACRTPDLPHGSGESRRPPRPWASAKRAGAERYEPQARTRMPAGALAATLSLHTSWPASTSLRAVGAPVETTSNGSSPARVLILVYCHELWQYGPAATDIGRPAGMPGAVR